MQSTQQKRTFLLHWINEEIQCYKNLGFAMKIDKKIQNISEALQLGFIERLFQEIDERFFSQQIPNICGVTICNLDYQGASKKIIEYGQAINQYLIGNYNKKLSINYENTYFNESIFSQLSFLNKSFLSYSFGEQSMRQTFQKQKMFSSNKLTEREQVIDNVDYLMEIQIEKSLIQIVKLQFYLLLQSSNKYLQDTTCNNQIQLSSLSQTKQSEFIKRIQNLPEQVQKYLMQQIKIIESEKIQNLIEFKELLNNLQSLEEQNQYFKEQIELIIEENQKLEKQIQQQISQQDSYTKEILKYHAEKEELFRSLQGISTLQEFVEFMSNIEKENSLLQNTISQLEERNYELQTSNAQSVHKINKNAKQITRINQQIGKYKAQIKGLAQDIEFYDSFCNSLSTSIDQESQILKSSSRNQNDDNILKEKSNVYNQQIKGISPQINKAFTHRIFEKSPNIVLKSEKKKLRKSPILLDQNNKENTIQRKQKVKKHFQHKILDQKSEVSFLDQQKQKYRIQLMKKLQNLYKEISDLTNDITLIKEQNKIYDRKNKISQKKIRDLKLIHEAFVKELDFNQ